MGLGITDRDTGQRWLCRLAAASHPTIVSKLKKFHKSNYQNAKHHGQQWPIAVSVREDLYCNN